MRVLPRHAINADVSEAQARANSREYWLTRWAILYDVIAAEGKTKTSSPPHE